MATLRFKNFFRKDSPRLFQIVGDIGLLASFLSSNILIFKQQLIDMGLTSIQNNPIFDKINLIALAVGATIKLISKFFGVKTIKLSDSNLGDGDTNNNK